jgi:purine nucleosidase
MNSKEAEEKFKHPLLKIVKDFSEVWFRERDVLTFHDPLAAMTIFNDDVCKFKRGNVEVELYNQEKLGQTIFSSSTFGTKEIASEVAPNIFFERYFEVFK